MEHIMTQKEKEKWIEKTLKEKENDPVYQKMVKDALKRQKERLIAISESHSLKR